MKVGIGVGVVLKMARGSCKRKELAGDGMNRRVKGVVVVGKKHDSGGFALTLMVLGEGEKRRGGKARLGLSYSHQEREMAVGRERWPRTVPRRR